MRKILIVYPDMQIGGSTTSLLGVLQSLDYSKVQVDLQLYEHRGSLLKYIPQEVNILPPARTFSANPMVGKLQRVFFPVYWKAAVSSAILAKKHPESLIANQITSHARAKTSRGNSKRYDVAIGFLEMWADEYVAHKAKADKKIAWIHVDYNKAGMVPAHDVGLYSKFDKIILVSEQCRTSFVEVFPQYRDKALFIENILLQSMVLQRAEESATLIQSNPNSIQFGTVCRIEFRSKGLDRAIGLLKKLHNEGYRFDWHIIGDGPDEPALRRMVTDFGLENCVHLYGSMENPLPYVKQFDCFLLPSRYEGKPMAVTEAQMLYVPPIVTNYASAAKQVVSGEEGYIMDNSEEGILEGLRSILSNPDVLKKWKCNLVEKNWNNDEAVGKIKCLIGGRCDG